MMVKVLVLWSFSVSGIRFGLKMLTVLFIGGASGSAQLLGCQRTDGAGGRFVAPHLVSGSKCGAFQGSIRRLTSYGQLRYSFGACARLGAFSQAHH